MSQVPQIRIQDSNRFPVRPDGEFVVYWMHAQRRLGWNFALQRALEKAREYDKPLLILEGLRCGYPWASDRHHAFVLEGMREHHEVLQGTAIGYYPYLEPEESAGSGLLVALARRAVCVVSDDHPGFFHPRMLQRAAKSVDVQLEAVDSCGIIPVVQPGRPFSTAFAFRRWLQKNLNAPLREFPEPDPLRASPPRRFDVDLSEIEERWPPCSFHAGIDELLASLPIDHSVQRVEHRSGGTRAARGKLSRFLEQDLGHYLQDRNQPQRKVTSGLSAYLHHGQISSHEAFAALAGQEGWGLSQIAGSARGGRAGWWGMSEAAEAFVDQLITWRELGFNAARFLDAHEDYDSLPEWSLRTLAEHEEDPRPHLYEISDLEKSGTHDKLWNAAQTQLTREGEMHNYLRMLWGKKILEWSASPRLALENMVHLNNKYALDGRDPNSYSGIFWVLGRYDRAWGPERPIFGKVRYMSSENTARKLRVKEYVERYGNESLV